MKTKKIILYQGSNGAVQVQLDEKKETIMLTQQQVGELFDVQKAAISKHVNNIFKSGELDRKSTVSILETVQTEGERNISRKIEYYNLDLILSVGYRVNSTKATQFRQWATKTLRQHILQGYTINKKRLAHNYEAFLKAVDDVKKLLPEGDKLKAGDTLELVKMFASTWFSLNAYDTAELPTKGITRKHVAITADQLAEAITELKQDLISKKQASDLFAAERSKKSIESIVGNIFQTFAGKDLYPTIEEKAAHLLYFMIKNHPFVDGNKRSGAFSFVWFLRQTRILNTTRLSPEALTSLALLVAESKPTDKERMIGLILMMTGRV